MAVATASVTNLLFMTLFSDLTAWVLTNVLELDRLQRLGVAADLADFVFERRDKAFLGKISLFAQRLFADVLGDELLDAGDHLHVLLLHVDEQRARRGILARRDGLVAGRNAIDH